MKTHMTYDLHEKKAVEQVLCSTAPVVDGGSSSRFAQRLLWVAAQTGADTTCFSAAPRCIETHPEHEEHHNHVEKPETQVQDSFDVARDIPFEMYTLFLIYLCFKIIIYSTNCQRLYCF